MQRASSRATSNSLYNLELGHNSRVNLYGIEGNTFLCTAVIELLTERDDLPSVRKARQQCAIAVWRSIEYEDQWLMTFCAELKVQIPHNPWSYKRSYKAAEALTKAWVELAAAGEAPLHLRFIYLVIVKSTVHFVINRWSWNIWLLKQKLLGLPSIMVVAALHHMAEETTKSALLASCGETEGSLTETTGALSEKANELVMSIRDTESFADVELEPEKTSIIFIFGDLHLAFARSWSWYPPPVDLYNGGKKEEASNWIREWCSSHRDIRLENARAWVREGH